jgi:hypothetical protein
MAADPSPITQVTIAWISFGGVALGALISGGFMFWGQTLTRKSEERRQRRELAINTAITYWQRDSDIAKLRAGNGLDTEIAPLDLYIIHMLKLSDLISRETLTEEEVAVELAKIKKTIRGIFEAAKEQDKKEGRYQFHDSPQE